MRIEQTSKYQEILNGGFSGGHTVCPGSVNLGDDVLVIMARHPDNDFGLDGSVCIINSRLLCDDIFKQRFKKKIRELNHLITDDMGGVGLDLASLALAYFCVSVDHGMIDPYEAPLTEAVKLSTMQGWAADMTACHVYSRYIDQENVDRGKAVECGSQQRTCEPCPKA